MIFGVLLLLTAIGAGAIAALAGFGIGSLVTPVLAVLLPMPAAVAVVAGPHLVASSLRLWLLRKRVDLRVLRTFGALSALAALAGALLQPVLGARGLGWLLAALLIFAGILSATGSFRKLRFRGPAVWLAGALSGGLGGLVGNQGGIRAAALLGLDLSPETFVATGTAVGIAVDLARLPVYLRNVTPVFSHHAGWIGLITAGVVTGTLLGRRWLARVSNRWFYRVVGIVLIVAGGLLALRFLL